MSRIDQKVGRGSGNSRLASKNPVSVTTTVQSQMITPTARTQRVDPASVTIKPAAATTSPT